MSEQFMANMDQSNELNNVITTYEHGHYYDMEIDCL